MFVFPSHSCECWGLSFQEVARHQFLLLLCSCPSFTFSSNLSLPVPTSSLAFALLILSPSPLWGSGCGLGCQRGPTHHMKYFVGSPPGCPSLCRFTTYSCLILLLEWAEAAPLCCAQCWESQSRALCSGVMLVQECLALFCCFLCCSNVSIWFMYQMATAMATSGLPAGSHPYSVPKIDGGHWCSSSSSTCNIFYISNA